MIRWVGLVLAAVMMLAAGCAGKPAEAPVEVDEPVGSVEPELPAAGPDIWPGVPTYPGASGDATAWGYHLQRKSVGAPSVVAWYREALRERGWVEESVSDPGAGRLVLSREGVYLSLGVSQWDHDTFVSLHQRDGLQLTEAQAMEVAKAIIGNHEAGVAWEVQFEAEHVDEAKGEGGYARPAWVIGRVYPAGNKEVVYVDALTAEPYQVWTIEGPGFGVE